MNLSSMVAAALNMLWWLVPVVVFITVLKSRWFKGVLGEALVQFAAKIRLPASTYHRIHNVTLPMQGGSTQIDHIFVSRFGIFVVETKNMKGLIVGGEHQAQWTQQFFKTSFKFQNPLRQNYKHMMALESALDISPELIHSVVAFVGQSTFKSPMPASVTRGMGYIAYIKSFREKVLSPVEVREILAKIQSARLPPSRATNRKHVKQLKKHLRQSAKKKCPECASPMVLRTAQRGTNAGQQFWGCSAYSKCTAVENIK